VGEPVTLSKGQTLTHYEILGPLGVGGMGEVYRARDSRLEREVAIKVLPPELIDSEDQLRRFEREATTLASLNHPHVAQIYGIDRAQGVRFLALELVPGESLAQRLTRGPLPLDEAVDVCRQIAEGLEAAHEAGVVHRDLKPANVQVTPEGVVKVLDFGLAKPLHPKEGTDRSLTTEEGVVLGTPTYMSPEQARGKPVDRRTDVWAFGCVLCECLSGRRAFDGESVPDVLAAVVSGQPDDSALPATTPAELRQLLSRCLHKDPRRRLRDMGDARIALEELCSGAQERSGGVETEARGRRASGAVVVLTVLLVAACALAISGWLRSADSPEASDQSSTRWPLDLPQQGVLRWRGTSANLSKLGGGSPLLAISRDGRRVAYCVDRGEASEIFLHDLGESFGPRPIPGTNDARAPFFSPDGDWLGFFADGALQIIQLDGGVDAQEVCTLSSPNFAACWLPEQNAIVYSTNAGLWRVDPNGENRHQIAAPRRDLGEVEYSAPSALPGGDAVLITVSSGTSSNVSLLELETGGIRIVVKEGTNGHYLGDERFVYAHGGGVRVLRFDPTAGEVAPVSDSVQGGVFTTPSAGGSVVTHYAVSAGGTLVYAPDVAEPPQSVVSWVEPGGSSEKITEGLGIWEHPVLSADGSRFAFDILDELGVKDVFVYDFGRETYDRVTTDGTSIMNAWSPEGDVVSRSTHLLDRIRRISLADGAVEWYPAVPGDGGGDALFLDSWSADGRFAILTRKATDGWSLWSLAREGAAPVRLLGPDNGPRFGALSRDGKWLAYSASERGNLEVFACPYPELNPRTRVSNAGGVAPRWSPDGKRLFYFKDGALLALSIETTSPFRVGSPEELLPAGHGFDWEPGGHQHYDLDRDRSRFLMVEHKRSDPTRIHVVLNWLGGA
jgi:serine/threonine-protein kinase